MDAVGATPPFGNRCVLKATSWRVGDEKDLPASIRAYLDEQPKMWREAPRDMDEIEALRAGKAKRKRPERAWNGRRPLAV